MAKSNKKKVEQKDFYNDASTVTGLHIYSDNKGHKVYYKARKMVGYVIKNENVRTYRTYANRYVTAGAATAVLFVLSNDWNMPIWISLVLGLCIWGVMEFRFQKVFLPSLVQLHNFIPNEKPSMLESISLQATWRLLAKVILFPTFGILLLILFQERQADVVTNVIGWIVLIAAIIYAIINLLGILRKSKAKKAV